MKSTLIYEEWRPVKDYEGLYEVSNFGRVRSLKFGKVRILKLIKIKIGYLYIGLYKDGRAKKFRVNRLVYEAFNGEIPDGMEVNHINEIKTDNSVWNLNLMTRKENNNYGKRTEKCSNPVLQLTLDGELVREWSSTQECGRNGFSQGCVSACCRGEFKQYKGFLWIKKC